LQGQPPIAPNLRESMAGVPTAEQEALQDPLFSPSDAFQGMKALTASGLALAPLVVRPFYHGTDELRKILEGGYDLSKRIGRTPLEQKQGAGLFLDEVPKFSQGYGKDVIKATIDDATLFDARHMKDWAKRVDELDVQIRKGGYRGIMLPHETIVFDPSVIQKSEPFTP
jgi:hypothetical protein